MDMNVEIQRGTKALDKRYGAALRFADGAEFRGATNQRCKHGLDEELCTSVIKSES